MIIWINFWICVLLCNYNMFRLMTNTKTWSDLYHQTLYGVIFLYLTFYFALQT